MDNPVLDAARAKRAKHQTKLDSLLEAPTAESRSLTDDETTEFEELAAKITKLDAQISLLEAEEARKEAAITAAAEIPSTPAVVRSEPTVYAEHNRETSFLRDLAAIQVSEAGLDARGARERMARHAREVEVEARTNPEIAARWREAGLEARTNPNTTAGTGGEFVPPIWLVSQYVPAFRPGRVFANRIQNYPLPPGIDVINIPKIASGSTTAIQSSQGSSVSSTDITTSTVSASVNTIAGQQDISLQLLEQSPIAMDGVVFQDLAADYDQRLDLQVVSGTGSSGQHKGVLYQGSVNAITCSQTAFFGTAGGQFPSIVSGVNSVETARYAPPTAIWVHPRRANYWSAAAYDGNTRPLFTAAQNGPYNAVGVNEASPVEQGVAGTLFGLPVIKDANMSTTMNSTTPTGGTADPIVVLKEDDAILWEGQLKMRALPEILSGTLQIRFQVYAYSALTFGRAPVGISVISGNTGLAAPTF